MKHYKSYWRNAFNIKTRSTPAEFWNPLWINIVLMILLSMTTFVTIPSIFYVATIIPSFTLMVRRFHDVEKMMFIPILYKLMQIVMIVMTAVFVFNALNGMDVRTGTAGIILLILGAGYISMSIYVLFVVMAPSRYRKSKYGGIPVGAKPETQFKWYYEKRR